MPYVITEACINTKDKACVDVCPVDCIYEGEQQLYIHPDECIDCGVCEPECPVDAIKPDTEPGLEKWLEVNAEYANVRDDVAAYDDLAADGVIEGRRGAAMVIAAGARRPPILFNTRLQLREPCAVFRADEAIEHQSLPACIQALKWNTHAFARRQITWFKRLPDVRLIAAGPTAALEQCQPLFKVLGKQVFVVGAQAEKANAVKIARNRLIAARAPANRAGPPGPGRRRPGRGRG